MGDESGDIPTLAAWAGGPDRFLTLFRRFYAKVPDDPVLAPVFADMPPTHPVTVARFVTEVLSGPADYTSHGGSHARMIARHMGRHLTEPQRRRWVDLMLDTLDEAQIPDDAEFRAALVGYLEWGTRLAVLNSQDGAEPPPATSPMPKWGWGPPGGPYRG